MNRIDLKLFSLWTIIALMGCGGEFSGYDQEDPSGKADTLAPLALNLANGIPMQGSLNDGETRFVYTLNPEEIPEHGTPVAMSYYAKILPGSDPGAAVFASHSSDFESQGFRFSQEEIVAMNDGFTKPATNEDGTPGKLFTFFCMNWDILAAPFIPEFRLMGLQAQGNALVEIRADWETCSPNDPEPSELCAAVQQRFNEDLKEQLQVDTLENLDDEAICSMTNRQMVVQPKLGDIEEEDFSSLEDAFENQDPK